MKSISLILKVIALWVVVVVGGEAEAQSLTSVTINGLKVPMNVVSNYAPVVGLHYWESYLPCSIDYVLAHAAVIEGQPSDYAADLTNGTVVLEHPSQAQLYNYAMIDPTGTNYYLSIEPEAFKRVFLNSILRNKRNKGFLQISP